MRFGLGWVAALGMLVVLGYDAWFVVTGPQNPWGWTFFLTMPAWAAGIAFLVSRAVQRH